MVHTRCPSSQYDVVPTKLSTNLTLELGMLHFMMMIVKYVCSELENCIV